ncbi:hypothetical protein U0C82_10460 [Fulvimarina sp. 2208YS6-2-32]|uniref:PAS domain-containing protein n=1 Tax=Fulvimarina uroteuthidis TaxID=3098149 RepID=A0ABU5I2G4_9HYPH|nr:hypothetical protein [Fulvimarina sp. 2208YS6-2-32]MDY8109560.1 hypothetical protein [Fulvimarina sp. 2208YS6-2-32]
MASASLDRHGWEAVFEYLEARFAGLQVSLETWPLSNEFPPRPQLLATSRRHQSARRAVSQDVGVSYLRFYGDAADLGPGRCAFELECDCAHGFLHRLRLSFAKAHEPAYRRSLEVLFEHIRVDIEDALRAEADMTTLSLFAIERLESLWTNLPFAIALISGSMRVLALNPDMDHLLSTRSLFRPSGPGGRLWLRDASDGHRLAEAVEDVANGTVPARAVRIGRKPDALILDVRRADASRSEGCASGRPLIVTARRSRKARA